MTKQNYKPKQMLLPYRQSQTGKLANLQSEEYFPTTSVKDRSGVIFFIRWKKNDQSETPDGILSQGDTIMTGQYMPERPDKYTGQEEDKESGLFYYKARYYDPMLGRFLQADGVVMPESTFGMNRYMYVSGSPVNYSDETGNAAGKPVLMAVALLFFKPAIEASGADFKTVALAGIYSASGGRNPGKDIAGGAKWLSNGARAAYNTFVDKSGFASGRSINEKKDSFRYLRKTDIYKFLLKGLIENTIGGAIKKVDKALNSARGKSERFDRKVKEILIHGVIGCLAASAVMKTAYDQCNAPLAYFINKGDEGKDPETEPDDHDQTGCTFTANGWECAPPKED